MKRILFIAAFAALFAACNNPSAQNVSSEKVILKEAAISYVNVERVMAESQIFVQEGTKLQERTETAQREWALEEQKLQAELAELNRKFQNGLITSTNAQLEQQKLEGKVGSFQSETQKQMSNLEEENMVFANRAQKLLADAVKNINKDKKYSMIINASALIDADSTLDISTIVLTEVDRLYKAESKK